MLAKYAIIVRRAGALTAVAAAIMVAVSAALVGVKGLIGALVGVAIVTVFFGISVLVVGWAARSQPAGHDGGRDGHLPGQDRGPGRRGLQR